jgi:hypothetical protein
MSWSGHRRRNRRTNADGARGRRHGYSTAAQGIGLVIMPMTVRRGSAVGDSGLFRLGARVTVVQGSRGTYHSTWGQPQQASFEAVRAVESGRPAVLVEMSGTSAAFDARGRTCVGLVDQHGGCHGRCTAVRQRNAVRGVGGDWAPAAAAAALLGLVGRGRSVGLTTAPSPLPAQESAANHVQSDRGVVTVPLPNLVEYANPSAGR